MEKMTTQQRILVAMHRNKDELDTEFTYRLIEIHGLCEAAGAEVIDTFIQERSLIDSALYLGKGKIEEIAEAVRLTAVEMVVFDGELSPGQVRNLEDRLNCQVVDRTQLILDIFAQRAQSKAGRLQVEIAQLKYMYPRLTGHGLAMSRLGGGIGTRGPGETKLETDRRRIRHRIAKLQNDLRDVQKTRAIQRDRRMKSVPVVALVGYTNAGKTSLLKRWTTDKGSRQGESGHHRLFDTLDPTARRVKAGAVGEMVLLDTVGFVQKLPHLLVDAFRSTLEEVRVADVIVHVVDASTPSIETHLATTYQVLEEIGATDKPIVTFFNKIDLVEQYPAPDAHAEKTIYGSAFTGVHIEELYANVEKLIGLEPMRIVMDTQHNSTEFWAKVAKAGKVIESVALEDGSVRVIVEVDKNYVTHINQVVLEEGIIEYPNY